MASVASSSDVWNLSRTTESQEHSLEPSLQSLPMYKIYHYIWYAGSPVVLLLGNFGNVATLIVMRRTKSGEQAVNLFFAALAIVDLITLDVYLLGDWIGIAFSIWVKNQDSAVCKVYNWISTCSTTISAWFLVSLTIHRAVSVVWPHRVNLLCSRQRVVVLLVAIATFFALVYSHYLYGFTLVYFERYNDSYCVMMPASYATFMQEAFTYIDLVLYSLSPFVCLILANGVLVWKLKTSVKETRDKLAQGSSGRTDARQRTTQSVTVTVILVSCAFIVLTLPASLYSILYYVATFTYAMSVYQLAEMYVILAVTYLLMFSNNAVNFYLYCLTGRRFREQFVSIIRCGKASRLPGS